MKSKNLLQISLGALLVGLLVLPVISSATTTPKRDNNGVKAGSKFCANLATKFTEQNKKLTDRLSKFETKKAEQLKKISENRLTADKKRIEVRTKVDENRDTRLVKLEARASTTEQKAAVATFRETLKTLATTRRTAVDAAIKIYRDSVDVALTTRKTAIESARTTLQTAIKNILEKAKTDCASGVDPETVRAEVNTGVKLAREQFSTTVKGLDKVKEVVTTASTVRQEAINKAQTDFKTAYEQALVTLKAAFKK